MKIKCLFLLVAFLTFNSCELVFNRKIKKTDFKYYSQGFLLDSNSKLKTDGFYASPCISADEEVYTYFKFFTGGVVHYFGGTSMVPGTVEALKIMDIERDKKGIPISKSASWGYYNCEGDSLKFTFLKRRALSSMINKYIGAIKGDTLVFEIFEEVSYDTSLVNRGTAKYVYYHSSR